MWIFLIFIGLIISGLFVWTAFLDGSYYVTRSIHLDVSREKAFNLVSDFNSWAHWSPWLCMESNADIQISHDGKLMGSIYSWSGNLVGTGEIEHKNTVKDVSLEQEIRFKKPFKSRSLVFWQFDGKGETSELTWGMKGQMPFIFKFMAKKMEPWIGMDYDRGLKMIKDLLEKGQVASRIQIDGIKEIPASTYIGMKATCPMNEVGTSMQETFAQLHEFVNNHNIEFSKALAVYHNFDLNQPNCIYSAGIITDTKLKDSSNGIFKSIINPQKAVKVIFTGDYKHLGNAWSAAYAFARKNKLKVIKSCDPVEFYMNNPQKEADPANWITEVYLPVR